MERLIQPGNVPSNDRGGYLYQRYVQQGDDVPFNFLRIQVDGRHATRKVLAGVRNYYVAAGRGVFVIEGLNYEVFSADLITIQPGERTHTRARWNSLNSMSILAAVLLTRTLNSSGFKKRDLGIATRITLFCYVVPEVEPPSSVFTPWRIAAGRINQPS